MAKDIEANVRVTCVETLCEFIMPTSADSTKWHVEVEVGEPYQPCWYCGEPCAFIEVDLWARLHPGICTYAKWAEYGEMLRYLRWERGYTH